MILKIKLFLVGVFLLGFLPYNNYKGNDLSNWGWGVVAFPLVGVFLLLISTCGTLWGRDNDEDEDQD